MKTQLRDIRKGKEAHEYLWCYCSCNIFPKFKKNWDPSLIHFPQLFVLFDVCAKIYFYASHVLLFELILPCCRKHVIFLSWESSYLHARCCGKEQKIKSESSVFGLQYIFLYRRLFWDPVETLVYTSFAVAEKVLRNFLRSCFILFWSPPFCFAGPWIFQILSLRL